MFKVLWGKVGRGKESSLIQKKGLLACYVEPFSFLMMADKTSSVSTSIILVLWDAVWKHRQVIRLNRNVYQKTTAVTHGASVRLFGYMGLESSGKIDFCCCYCSFSFNHAGTWNHFISAHLLSDRFSIMYPQQQRNKNPQTLKKWSLSPQLAEWMFLMSCLLNIIEIFSKQHFLFQESKWWSKNQ